MLNSPYRRRCYDHFGDRQVKKEEFQNFIRREVSVHEQFDKIDFATSGGLSSFAKLLLKYRDRELGVGR